MLIIDAHVHQFERGSFLYLIWLLEYNSNGYLSASKTC